MPKAAQRTEQLQIRVTREEKRLLKRSAKLAGQNLSAWVLERALSKSEREFQQLQAKLATSTDARFVMASINDFISGLTASDFTMAVNVAPHAQLSPFHLNWVAAMVEHGASLKGIEAPDWVHDVKPLVEPFFATKLKSLRQHLLMHAPVIFRRRNLFVDSSLGNRL